MNAVQSLVGNYRDAWASGGAAARWFLAGGFTYAMRILIWGVSFPLYAKEKGFDPGQIGLLLAAVAFSLVIFGIPFAWLGTQGYSRKLLIIGPLIAASGLLVVLLSPGTAMAPALVGCLLSGMASNSYWTLGDPLLARVVPPQNRPHVYALKFALITTGFGIGGLLGGWVPEIASLAGASPLAALGSALVVMMFLDFVQSYCFWRIPYVDTISSRSTSNTPVQTERVGRFAMWGVFILLLVPEMGMATGFHAIRPYLSLFFDEEFGVATGRTGTLIGLMQLASGFSALLIPSLAAKIGNVSAMALLRFLAGLSIMLMLGAAALPIVILLLFTKYAIVDGTEATFVTEVMGRLPDGRRTTFAAVGAISWSLFAALAAAMSGFLQDATGGFSAAFAYGAAGYIFSAVWLVLVYPRIPRLFSTADEDLSHEIEATTTTV